MNAQKLVLDNRELAKGLARRARRRGFKPDDLLWEAYLGLCIAATRFDPGRKRDFTLYASFWIRSTFTPALRRSHLIQTPEPSFRRFLKLERFTQRVIAETGSSPSVHDVATRFRIKVSQASRLLRAKRASEVELLGLGVYGLQASQDAEPRWEPEELELVSAGLQELEPRDRDILIRRCQDETLEAIGADYGLTRERVRQIEHRAIERLAAWVIAEKCRRRRSALETKTHAPTE